MNKDRHMRMWRTEPLAAFEEFILSTDYLNLSRRLQGSSTETVLNGRRQLSPASARIYLAMFGKLMDWLKKQNRDFLSLDSHLFFEFLNQKDEHGNDVLKSAIQHRYIRLIENIFDYLKIETNPARHIAKAASNPGSQLSGKDKAPVFLTPEEMARVLESLPLATAQPSAYRPHAGWKKRRDRAMQCLMIGAGLKVAEVVGLQISEVGEQPESDGSLRISLIPEGKSDTTYEHDTFLSATLVADVLNWMNERTLLPVPGELLFPGTHGDPLDKATVYSQVKRTFQRAGLDLTRMGGRTLRNTYALQELENGTSVRELQEKMGLAMEKSALHYQSLKRRSTNIQKKNSD